MAPSGNPAGASSEFKLCRTFQACREDVWKAFTDAEHLKHWWGAPGSSIDVIRHELREGGKFHYRMRLADGRLMWGRFLFREIRFPERLVWLNGFSDDEGGLSRNPWVPAFPLQTLNTVTFEEHSKTTRVTILVTPFEASDEEIAVFSRGVKGMTVGFGDRFQVLANYLAKQS